MNRRDFLERGSIAAVAVAGLPRAIRSFQKTPSRYKTKLQYGIPDQWYYEMGLYHSAIQNLANAPEEEKSIGLKVLYYETKDHTKPSESGEYKYIIKKSELVDKASNTWEIKIKLDQKLSGDHKFPKSFKNMKFQCKPYSFVNILSKKGKVLANIPYAPATSSSSSSGGGGCFLTTACVEHKGLPDDCEELTTLRFLRDQFMNNTEDGRNMVDLYKKAGPAIVKSISLCDNKTVIYEYIHKNMILPSVGLVRQGKYDEAVRHYKAYVNALVTMYC